MNSEKDSEAVQQRLLNGQRELPALHAIYRGTPQYPARLSAFLGDSAPAAVRVCGNLDLLAKVDSGQCRSLAIAASVSSSAGITETALGLLRSLFRKDLVFVGGFHSPLEQSCLRLVIRDRELALACLGRSLVGIRFPRDWQTALREGRLVLLSAANDTCRRPTRESIDSRNECVAALSSRFLALSAAVGGKTQAVCQRLISSGREVWALDHPDNQALLAAGALPVNFASAAQLVDSRFRGLAQGMKSV